jgi:hypothetical protein
MAFPDDDQNQTAVYWASPTPDGRGGHTWDTAVEINCRWEGSTELIRASNGEQIVSRAVVQVSQDLNENGMLYLGELDDLTTAQKANPMTVSTAYLIRKFDKIPEIDDATVFYREAYL